MDLDVTAVKVARAWMECGTIVSRGRWLGNAANFKDIGYCSTLRRSRDQWPCTWKIENGGRRLCLHHVAHTFLGLFCDRVSLYALISNYFTWEEPSYHARWKLFCCWLWNMQKDQRYWNLETAESAKRGVQEVARRLAERDKKNATCWLNFPPTDRKRQGLYLWKTFQTRRHREM